MIKIGEFADIFGISIKTIRFYESKGLITPSVIDIYSGYRYYDENNIKEMSKILALKNLGLELNEIRAFDEEKIESKIKEYESKIRKFSDDINILKSLSKEKGGMKNLKTFVNDENVIGKWKLEGIYDSKEDYPNKKSDFEIGIKELYLMPKGEKYWVISWTKGIIYICERENRYELDNDKMFVYLVDPIELKEEKIAIYNKVDNTQYTIEDIKIKDNTNVEFVKDEKLMGFWKCVDFIQNKNSFNPIKRQCENLYLKQITVTPDEKVLVEYEEQIKVTKYTKHYIIDLCLENTLCKYEYQTINNKVYMFVEWKSGDYIFGNMINGYYVLEKIN